MSEQKSIKYQIKRGAERITTIIMGTIITLVATICVHVLLLGFNKTEKLEASHLSFKDKTFDLISSYKDFTISNINCLKSSIEKNTYHNKILDMFINEQKKTNSSQEEKMDRIIQDLRDLNKTVLITVTKMEMQSSQTIQIEEITKNVK